jgi:hypothetical protein
MPLRVSRSLVEPAPDYIESTHSDSGIIRALQTVTPISTRSDYEKYKQ